MKTIISTPNAPSAIGPYFQANALDNLIFTSGQIGLIPATGELAGGDIQTQTRQALNNLKAILEEAGSGMDKVLKTTVLLSDIANFTPMNEVYAEFFSADGYPSRSAFQVGALPKGALVEIAAIAYK